MIIKIIILENELIGSGTYSAVKIDVLNSEKYYKHYLAQQRQEQSPETPLQSLFNLSAEIRWQSF